MSQPGAINPRFAGTARLLGAEGFARVAASHVCVIGLGGVGSWVVEALARSGVGALTLVDQDEVCISNVNRQLHALTTTVGQSKAEALAQRVALIHPDCRVQIIPRFFKKTTAEEILAPGYDVVVDAIDGVAHKARLIGMCWQRGLPVIASGGAGGKCDAARVCVADLADTVYDPLLAFIRKRLRKWFDFPRGDRKFGIPCVYSPEPPAENPESCRPAKTPGVRANCDTGLGALAPVTGTFGLLMAGYVINRIAG
ncbi:MAG TPA: tRNA threonylcarbamoyladenosine dehydratase, partial [Kiritimatiellia bacterium]|nr:tRNA threonylcarbamoyladenosine dehydratase [Kiritimatiellia bacterium]